MLSLIGKFKAIHLFPHPPKSQMGLIKNFKLMIRNEETAFTLFKVWVLMGRRWEE
jgi:hypothetical protein